MAKYNYIKALKSYQEFNQKVLNFTGTMKELYHEVKGFNYNNHYKKDELFDCYPMENEELVVTVIKEEDKPIRVTTIGIELWSDNSYEYQSLSLQELKEYAKKEEFDEIQNS